MFRLHKVKAVIFTGYKKEMPQSLDSEWKFCFLQLNETKNFWFYKLNFNIMIYFTVYDQYVMMAHFEMCTCFRTHL